MKEFQGLLDIMEKLRDPENGCPWDISQTPSSLKEYILEESYELIEAIDNGSDPQIVEELGDLLLQIIFISQIMKEKSGFSIKDVLKRLNDKLVLRHPHIFGNRKAVSAAEVKNNWEKIKKKEKRRASILSDYPEVLPALTAAKRYGEQAASVGFDWNRPELAIKKVEEELKELKKEIKDKNREKTSEELGDLLFSIANVARLTGINPEFALRDANRKFKKRFRSVEEKMKKKGLAMESASLEIMNDIWNSVKDGERTG